MDSSLIEFSPIYERTPHDWPKAIKISTLIAELGVPTPCSSLFLPCLSISNMCTCVVYWLWRKREDREARKWILTELRKVCTPPIFPLIVNIIFSVEQASRSNHVNNCLCCVRVISDLQQEDLRIEVSCITKNENPCECIDWKNKIRDFKPLEWSADLLIAVSGSLNSAIHVREKTEEVFLL